MGAVHEQFERVLDGIDAIVWEAEVAPLRMTFVSAPAERLLGYPVRRWTEEPSFWVDHIHPDDRDWVLALCNRETAAGAAHSFEYRMITATGKVVWLRDTVTVECEDGQPRRSFGVMVDVTEKKQADADLRHALSLHEATLEAARDGILVVDGEGRVAGYNGTFARMWGLPEPHLRAPVLAGTTSIASLVGRDPAKVVDQVCTPHVHPEAETADVVTVADGRTLERYSRPQRLGGEVVGRVWTFRDVTAAREAEDALRDSEARFRSLARAAPVGIFHLDAQGRCIYMNERVSTIIGQTPEESFGDGWIGVLHEDDRERVVREWEGAVRDGIPWQAEYRFRRPNGEVTWVLGRQTPQLGSAGETLGFVGTLTDITAQKLAEEELKRSREELEIRVAERTRELAVANRELESFSYSVSHDLRTPLRAIDGFSSLLEEELGEKLGPEGARYIARIRQGSRRMAELIDDLLRLSRVTRIQLKLETVDLTAIAREVEADLRATAPGRQVDVILQEGMRVTGDPALLRIVVENLLGNAWKFTSRNPTARIEFFADTEGGRTVYRVRDDGVGFDAAFAGGLFQAFNRLHSQEEFEGTGIGLATVRRILDRHGGSVAADGAVGKGATVSFTLWEHARSPA